MLHARADQRVLGYLGRALSLELTAVQQYSTQARLAATWGLAGAAERFHTEAGEEMGHADRIITRMLALGVAPSASQLRPVQLARDLRTLLMQNQAFEQELVKLYGEASRHCQQVGDHDNRLFFEGLLEEERAHASELAQWLEELARPGAAAAAERATF